MQLATLFSSFFLLLAISTAWPWPPTFSNLRDALSPGGDTSDVLLKREPAAAAAAAAAAATTAAAIQTATSSASSAAATSGAKSSGASATAKPTAAKSIPQDAAAGGFSMLTPAQTSQTYAKIGAQITFVWNYTSLLAPPSAVDVVASNTDGAWTIASNMSVKETGSVVWNTSNEATPLPMESYTLMIFDSAAGATAVPKPGHLSPYGGYGFAMYKPQPYVASGDFFCATCNAAANLERQSIRVLLGTAALTILSFTWFSCGGL